jgi:hypothetical protein
MTSTCTLITLFCDLRVSARSRIPPHIVTAHSCVPIVRSNLQMTSTTLRIIGCLHSSLRIG